LIVVPLIVPKERFPLPSVRNTCSFVPSEVGYDNPPAVNCPETVKADKVPTLVMFVCAAVCIVPVKFPTTLPVTSPVSAPVKVLAVICVVALMSAPTILLFAMCRESIEFDAIFADVTAFAAKVLVSTAPAVIVFVATTDNFCPVGVLASKVNVPLEKV